MKTAAILGLALTGSALARSTLHVERPQQQLLDDADNQLHSYFNMPNNQGNIQFNDYTVQRDAADNELSVGTFRFQYPHDNMGVSKDEMDKQRYLTRSDDAADNELSVGTFRFPFPHEDMGVSKREMDKQRYMIPRNDDADNELSVGTFRFRFPHEDIVLSKPEMDKQRYMTLRDDDADNELHNYFTMDKNQGNIQFNDYTVQRDAADDELMVPPSIEWMRSHQQPTTDNKRNQRESVLMNDDEADNQLHSFFTMDNNQGNIQFNDYSKTHDDEFVSVAVGSQKLTKDEIDTLASILKLATQDKDGNVMIDGVKIGKLPKQETKKPEVPKTKKFLGL